MKTWTVAAALLFVGTSCLSQTAQTEATAPTARKACEDLKGEIAKKLDAKGVVGYTLDVVDKGKEAADAKIVGGCDGGTKSIVYTRGGGAAPAKADSADAKKPQ
jgi:Protein of unknown function (DUF1161)